jgi:UDP-N-acetyl-D-glucosamine dehydrogenase
MDVDAAVLGLGYVGLPLARAMTGAGLVVTGFDVSPPVVAGLAGGRSHVDDVSDDDLRAMLTAGFRPTTDAAGIGAAGAAVICVPTPLLDGHGPDLRPVVAAATTIARHLRPGMLVVLESTTYPGTTDDVVRPLLEEGSGLAAGVDFHLAFSPERIDPGNGRYGAANTPKVVGGHTPGCTVRAAEFYQRFVTEVVPTKGTREAEMAKLLENTYRHINIALVNEMARFCHELGIDLWDAIRAAASKPFGFQAFYPGPGVGGQCIPIDPNYLSHKVRTTLGYPFRFVELAQEVNATMPAYVARRTQDILNDDGKAANGASILLLGVTYKPDVSDPRESPAAPLARHLAAMGAKITYHDPYVTDWRVPGVEVIRAGDVTTAAAAADVVVLIQNHRQYDADRLAEASRRFFDTRGATSTDAALRL